MLPLPYYYVLHKHVQKNASLSSQHFAAIIFWKHNISTPPQNVWKLWKQVDIDNLSPCFMMIQCADDVVNHGKVIFKALFSSNLNITL